MKDVIKLHKYKFEIKTIQDEVNNLLEKVDLHPHHNQICLNHTKYTKNDWYEGCGSLTYTYTNSREVYPNTSNLKTSDFIILNDDIKGSYLEKIYNVLRSDYKIGRFRLMALPHKKCMSFHKDTHPRLHIPVVTNENCKLIIENTSYYLENDGSVYWADVTKIHTALNGDNNFLMRLHLLFDTF